MDLPVMPPVAPMLAKAAATIPAGASYEPKWDGFRAIVFRDGDEVVIGSRSAKPLTRYFPELVEAIRAELPPRCVVDGEIVLAADGRLRFEQLQARIHPAASRIALLAGTTPASLVAFDVLALGEEDLTSLPFAERRERLTRLLERPAGPRRRVHLTPATTDLATAQRWFTAAEAAGCDGVVAKGLHLPYRPGVRAMTKVKHARTADCVVAGLRWHTSGADAVGSLLLGLYRDDGALASVGVIGAFPMATRRTLARELAPLVTGLDAHPWGGEPSPAERTPRTGETSRWNAGKDLSFVPLVPELVVEVAYDHTEGDRFRHTTQFRRWRPDRDPASCTYAQLTETAALADLSLADLVPTMVPRPA